MPAKLKRAAVAKGKRKSGATTAARAPGSVRQNNRPLFEKMIETLPFNIIGTDADFIIRYLNPSTLRTLKTLEPLLPVKVEQIAGHPLELFHKALAPQEHGRSELPREADIRLGPETLHFSIAPLYDARRRRCGSVVWWEVTTARLERRQCDDDNAAAVAAIAQSHAAIELDMAGAILTANDNFLAATGYSLDEIRGKHFSIFCDDVETRSAAYKEFWARLKSGQYQAGEYRLLGHGGKPVWMQAAYHPIFDESGKPRKIVSYATDVTAHKLQIADYAGQVAAIGNSQAVIEFGMDGVILDANQNFEKAAGYKLAEIKGRHHSVLVGEAQAQSAEYKEFWARLNRGELITGQYKRTGKGGKEVWIHVSYNPILDHDGKPFKVVEYATDITAQVRVKLEVARMAEEEKLATDELITVSHEMSSAAEETSAQASLVAAAAGQVSANVETVATGTEEMTASIREIAKNVSEAARVAIAAVKLAQSTNATVAKLGVSSTEIGEVIKVITTIAQQTNLLALNATIEAARAGEAGKGFAVVANEVKELAKQTAKATGDISQRIDAIQTDTKGAVDAIAEISGIINQISDISNLIASAVEEQSATTNEIARNVQEAAKGAHEIAKSIDGVAGAAANTSKGATNTYQVASAIAQMTSKLQDLMKQF